MSGVTAVLLFLLGVGAQVPQQPKPEGPPTGQPIGRPGGTPPLVAVVPMTVEGAVSQDLGHEVARQLSLSLGRDARVRVVSPTQLEAALKEQGFSVAMLEEHDAATRLGKVLGADYVVLGRVAAREGKAGGGGGFGRLGGIGRTSRVDLDLSVRMIGVAGGQVAAATSRSRPASLGVAGVVPPSAAQDSLGPVIDEIAVRLREAVRR